MELCGYVFELRIVENKIAERWRRDRFSVQHVVHEFNINRFFGKSTTTSKSFMTSVHACNQSEPLFYTYTNTLNFRHLLSPTSTSYYFLKLPLTFICEVWICLFYM